MEQITERLWISDIETVETQSVPPAINIVVSTCQDGVGGAVDCVYEQFRMADGRQDENDGDHSYEFFAQTVEYVRKQLQADRTILVHCHLGISRSGAVTATTLAAERALTFSEALEMVKDARSKVDPKADLRAHGRRYLSNQSSA